MKFLCACQSLAQSQKFGNPNSDSCVNDNTLARAARPFALTPAFLASLANDTFQASNPAPVLPQVAADPAVTLIVRAMMAAHVVLKRFILGPVDIHLDAMRAATRFQFAA